MLALLKKEKILIITGDGGFGEKLVAALKKDGYESVYLIKNGNQSVKSMCDILPHLILLDVTLPGTSGYEVLARKQSESLLAKIPVFLMSVQGVPINIRNVPPGSVAEFILSLYADNPVIVEKVNRHFGHGAGSSDVKGINEVGLPKKKLLWVEDDRLIGSILSKKLTAAGFELFQAKNGEEALVTLRTVLPDVIVVDLLLPGMDGFEILRAIGGDARLKSVPKMVLSNLSKPSDVEKAKALGASKFLVKVAFSLDQIIAEIKGICR